MRITEMRELTDEELNQELNNLKEKLFQLRFQLELGQLKNSSSIKQVKKDIARIKTILKERELGIRR
ncbi:ribosomal protein L29 [Petrotoga mobilis SJ95]|jgi:large subunit ribosomal protein L29|uniref:Large ribosomal subunit protein uL29 n=1 Tax=Petrotoga mobilis (strain DSM 10674 / SJ95) TaxID=403833 RepID=RL29_PETMO|nr:MULTISPECIES: 50S ribosomal protein L29 [Petrotoga]A9BH97.1 RecName: Full=Large ribosomal subunit protein uL29; AltName: Full=50S ribosomal protein L29 [Petrotoga mobilis SJ95]MDK2812069.1 large subunit ribosomal protein [Petrotoga sp.]ABX31506.1 ribosomal protein L29 [Petrotoga mobilis SJ95]MBL5981795.1 50S ribosomal protein L29 [Petrotoga sp. 8T1HF07.NaAc.6.1]PNR89743.1 50S ribosomal protein L29 [Petrotoga sp. 9T1HF07.CasAA.8.2]PNR91910.1 50S ribosomal protein L29 [Petrotoga sp. HWHPT.55